MFRILDVKIEIEDIGCYIRKFLRKITQNRRKFSESLSTKKKKWKKIVIKNSACYRKIYRFFIWNLWLI